MIYTAEKTLADLVDKLSKEHKEKIESGLKEIKSVLESNNMEKIKKETENLQKILQEIGAAVYQEAAKSAKKEESGEEKVVDADFKVEK